MGVGFFLTKCIFKNTVKKIFFEYNFTHNLKQKTMKHVDIHLILRRIMLALAFIAAAALYADAKQPESTRVRKQPAGFGVIRERYDFTCTVIKEVYYEISYQDVLKKDGIGYLVVHPDHWSGGAILDTSFICNRNALVRKAIEEKSSFIIMTTILDEDLKEEDGWKVVKPRF